MQQTGKQLHETRIAGVGLLRRSSCPGEFTFLGRTGSFGCTSPQRDRRSKSASIALLRNGIEGGLLFTGKFDFVYLETGKVWRFQERTL